MREESSSSVMNVPKFNAAKLNLSMNGRSPTVLTKSTSKMPNMDYVDVHEPNYPAAPFTQANK